MKFDIKQLLKETIDEITTIEEQVYSFLLDATQEELKQTLIDVGEIWAKEDEAEEGGATC